MPPNLALFLGCVLIYYALKTERRRCEPATEVFWPTLWYLVVASHPVGNWLQIWDLPLLGGSSAEEGSPIDRYFYFGLALIGTRILRRRYFAPSTVLRLNPWLTSLLIFMALSILWSSYSFISFKRFIKVLASAVMVLVILTNERPLDAFLTVLRRTLYIHLPMSIICIKYFREIGVSYDWFGGTSIWQGISTSKNTMGQVAMLASVYFFWQLKKNWATQGWRNLNTLYALMAMYLLKGQTGSVSMTSVSVSVFALVIFFRLQALRDRLDAARSFARLVFSATAALVLLIMTHSVVHFEADSIFGHIITGFGRDITLTDRLWIWQDVYAAASGNPLLGVGFGGFWIERIANIPWNSTMTWVLAQAHNGYVDTYLQVGLIGIFLFAGMIFTSFPRMVAALDYDFDFACLRITLFLTILFVDMTESVFLRGDNNLWFIFQIVLLTMPVAPTPETTDEHPEASTVEEEDPVPHFGNESAGSERV